MTPIKYYICTLMVAIAIVNGACQKGDTRANDEVETSDSSLIKISKLQFQNLKMEMLPLSEQSFDALVRASGQITVPPQSHAKVTPYIAGYVKTTTLLVGDRVTKGAPLVTLESPEYIDLQREYLEISGQIHYFKSEYERQKALLEENITSQKKYLEAESDYKKAKAEYESLRQKLSLLRIDPQQVEQGKFVSTVTIYAPISGNIVAVNVHIGAAVSTSDVILEIVDNGNIHLTLSVFEKDIFHLKKGQRIKFFTPQIGGEEFEAEISVIGTSVHGSDRTIPVFATLGATAKQKLITGMFVEAQLIASSRQTKCAPIEAIISEESSRFVLLLESEHETYYLFRKTLVKLGERNGDKVELLDLEQVDEHSKILTKGVYDIS